MRSVVAKTLRSARHAPDVDDVVQEALTRLSAAEAAGEPLTPVYAVGVARHVAIDTLRRKVRGQRLFEEPGEFEQEYAAPAESQSQSLDAQAAVRALETLPEAHARALYLFHVDGKPYSEIADAMGTSIGSVATWISRGRAQLRAQFQGENQ